MAEKSIHQCECVNCLRAEAHPDKRLHQQMNLLVSRLDEQQRRWYVALEAQRLGHGGIELMSRITGLSVPTIRRGLQELAQDLTERPTERIRQPGGGRKPVEKNN
jgi:hypothetical protein